MHLEYYYHWIWNCAQLCLNFIFQYVHTSMFAGCASCVPFNAFKLNLESEKLCNKKFQLAHEKRLNILLEQCFI